MTDTSSPSSQRRRSRAFVTKNACIECRKRKARVSFPVQQLFILPSEQEQCDGQKPCARCSTLEGAVCRYAVSVRVSKESMKADIEALQAYQVVCENIIGALATGNETDLILQRVRDGDRLEDIYRSLDGRPPLADSSSNSQSSWAGASPQKSRTGSWSTGSSSCWEGFKDCMQSTVPDFFIEQEDPDEQSIYRSDQWIGNQWAGNHWTTVTSDHDLLEHLLSLYFCWEYPIFACLSKKHFLEDFYAGRSRYCSSMLVNVLLALGSRFADQPETGANSLGNQFYEETERLWGTEQLKQSLTTIQAISLMSNWEASRGNERKSSFYSRQAICMAVEMGLHLPVNDIDLSRAELEVRSVTFWGSFALDQ